MNPLVALALLFLLWLAVVAVAVQVADSPRCPALVARAVRWFES
ncbi:membrane protein [Gordonia phage Sapo]|nr:membrane protein [Gordonia phage Sapo]